jgi:hypothetical protein
MIDLGIIVTIIVCLVAFAFGYGIMSGKVERNCKIIEQHNGKILETKDLVIEERADIKHIKNELTKIYSVIEKIHIKLQDK